MSQSYEILETLQDDVIAVLRATPTLADASIMAEANGDIESQVERALGLHRQGSGGKAGLVLIVLQPEVTEAEGNLPGPPLIIRQEIQVIEHPRINRSAAGSGLRSSHAAVLALHALHHHIMGSHSLYAEAKPIEPLPAREGLVSHVVSLFMRANGVAGPGKVAAVTVAEGVDATLSSVRFVKDAPGARDSGEMLAVDESSAVKFSTNGQDTVPDPTGPEAPEEFWYAQMEDDSSWTIFGFIKTIVGESDPIYTELGSWSSSDSAASPDLATWPAGQSVTGTTGGDTIILTCTTAGAAIYYTTDGSYPDATNGTLYTAPIEGAGIGTTYRTAAYKTGLNPGNCLQFTITE